MGNFVYMKSVLAIVDAQSEPSKKMMRSAKEQGKFVDLTKGKKTHSYIILKDGYVAASMLVPSTIVRRISRPNFRKREAYGVRDGNVEK